jgi:hypothetical protein
MARKSEAHKCAENSVRWISRVFRNECYENPEQMAEKGEEPNEYGMGLAAHLTQEVKFFKITDCSEFRSLKDEDKQSWVDRLILEHYIDYAGPESAEALTKLTGPEEQWLDNDTSRYADAIKKLVKDEIIVEVTQEEAIVANATAEGPETDIEADEVIKKATEAAKTNEEPEPEVVEEPEPEVVEEPEPEVVEEPEPEVVEEPEPEVVKEPEPEVVKEPEPEVVEVIHSSPPCIPASADSSGALVNWSALREVAAASGGIGDLFDKKPEFDKKLEQALHGLNAQGVLVNERSVMDTILLMLDIEPEVGQSITALCEKLRQTEHGINSTP